MNGDFWKRFYMGDDKWFPPLMVDIGMEVVRSESMAEEFSLGILVRRDSTVMAEIILVPVVVMVMVLESESK